jgi:tetratricopeptide (TPR) repeat protein
MAATEAAEAFDAGRKAFGEEKYYDALKQFQKASETDNKNPEVFIWLGKTYLALGKVDDAVKAWQTALDLAPGNATLIARLDALKGATTDFGKEIALMEELLEQRMYKNAITKGQELLKTVAGGENRTRITLLLAEATCGAGEGEKALEQIIAWRKANDDPKGPNQDRALLDYGRALALLHKTDDARKQFADVVAKYPGTDAALQANFELARILQEEGNAQQAVDAYIKFLGTDEAKKAASRWFVRQARESAFMMLIGMKQAPAVPVNANALLPGHEKAVALVVDAAKLGDDSQLGNLLKGLQALLHPYVSQGDLNVASGAFQRVVDALPDTSRYKPEALLMLGVARHHDGALIFQKNMDTTGVTAEEKTPNVGFTAAVDAYLKAAASPDARPQAIQDIHAAAEFYMRAGLPDPAIIIQTRLAAFPQENMNVEKVALANLYFRKEIIGAEKLIHASLQVPKAVSEPVKQALAIVKEVGAADRKSEAGKYALDLGRRIAGFYVALEYYDQAAEAMNLLLDKPAPEGQKPEGALADYVMVTRAEILHATANRDFLVKDASLGGIKKVKAVTDLHNKALDAYQKVVSDYPDSPVIIEARRGMAAIAQMYMIKANWDVARGIFQKIAAGNANWAGAEQMTYSAAQCLVLKAAEAFKEASKAGKPQQLSPEYDAAMKDYVAAVKAKPQGFLVPEAYKGIRGIALVYARAGAWDVAANVYQALLDKDLAYSYPEQVQFERALCAMGPAMPEHALKMLELIATEPVPVPFTKGSRIDEWGFIPPPSTSGRDGDVYDATGLDKEVRDLKDKMSALKGRMESAGGADESGDEYFENDEKNFADLAKPAEKPAVTGGASGESGKKTEEEYRNMQVVLAEKQKELSRRVAMAESKQQQDQQQQAGKYPASVQADLRNFRLEGDRIVPVVLPTEDEINRAVAAFNAAYAGLQAIIKENPGKPAATKARTEIMVIIEQLRSMNAPNQAAVMLEKFIADNPTDGALMQLSLQVVSDYLAWARISPNANMPAPDRIAESGKRFTDARAKLAAYLEKYAAETELVGKSRMLLVGSFLDEARLLSALSPAQARARYVRAATELLKVGAEKGADHAGIFNMLSTIANELDNKSFRQDAIDVYKMMEEHYPVTAKDWQIGLRKANDYSQIGEYLKAVESYQEVLSSNAKINAADVQQRILAIGQTLSQQSRWVEALHVYGVFVDSFPQHPQAGEALRAIGEIHQKNQAWQDAIKAYERVIEEYKNGDWTRLAKLSIATCYMQLSQWKQAIRAYEDFVRDYPKDGQVPNIQNKIPVLKFIDSDQQLIDEGKSPKLYDAQNEIARAVETKLNDKVKAIVEYEKVVKNYPDKYLAGDALYAVGRLHLELGDLAEGRKALARVAIEYPTNPMADDALYLLGQSFEKEAQQIEGITREQAEVAANTAAQKDIYQRSQQNLQQQEQQMKEEIKSFEGKGDVQGAEKAQARMGEKMKQARYSQAGQAATESSQIVEAMTAYELANKQDRVNAALRDAINAYDKAAAIASGDHAADALLRMATIYETRLKNPGKAMEVYEKIVKTFPGTSVAEGAVWRRAQYFEQKGEYAKAAAEYTTFINNYPKSQQIEQAWWHLAEMYEQLKAWTEAINTYRSIQTNFQQNAALVQKAEERINWIKTYRMDVPK